MAARSASPTSTTSSTLSNITVHTEKQVDVRAMSSASPSISTPPTSLDDEFSVLSDTTKAEQLLDVSETTHAPPEAEQTPVPRPLSQVPSSEGRRPERSSRKSVTTYNVQILAGTAIHTPTKYLEKHHKNVLHGSLESLAPQDSPASTKKRVSRSRTSLADVDDPVEEQLVAETAQAARRRTSSRVTDLRKEALRNISGVGQVLANALSDGKALVQNGLRRTVPDAPRVLNAKRSRAATEDEDDADTSVAKERSEESKPKAKVWLRQGLYVGQHRDFDPRLSESQNRARKRAKKTRVDDVLPLPMFAAERLFNEDPHHVFRDFKLPFDTYNPLPRKVKVDGWVKLNKNRFIGDASALWKRDKQDASQCYCDPEDGCGEACHNRIMAYECDDTNCRLGTTQCGNRPFAELKRRAKGNRYDYGVEVMDTVDRGYGVRAMRMFDPHQIIVEYAGEIITQTECERRMKQVYKKDKCYYLMSFDNKMIIDATRGTIARFVNHSCEPNCEMIKWTVGGEPRMALFAGRRGIMTGEELTYDYNFDPFSQKNIQQCRCGTESCRGVLGPKPKKPIEDRSFTSVIIAGTKRKLHDMMGSARAKSEEQMSPKKRKMHDKNSATTKAKNANMQSEAAREKAERDAAEHSRQIASRQTRALKRSTVTKARRGHVQHLRNREPTMKSTRMTTVSFQRKVPKAGALKAVKQPVRSRAPSQSTKSLPRKGKRNERQSTPMTPTKRPPHSHTDSEEDLSPNITPASLRSASRQVRTSSVARAEPNTASNAKAKHRQIQMMHKAGTNASAEQQRRSMLSVSKSRGIDADAKKPSHALQGRTRVSRGS
ncbi:SET domain-containing protein [Setomelanomma holmii]|uniref:SET domain-containing protein n=1 Tax=Setomelanomma holmii TaxID=210430 RepID=A0A9P4LS58_9PLEO|nr:SET domain-containing protein [Setomelanomma holmii]